MLRRAMGLIYLVLAVVFGLFSLLLFLTHLELTRWRDLLFALVFALGAVVAMRMARESFTARDRIRAETR
jgi:hypothetical protein